MEKIIKKIFLVVCLAAAMVFCIGDLSSEAYAAKVGGQLAQPEDGWQRIDDSNPKLYYSSAWSHLAQSSDKAINSVFSKCTSVNEPVTIKFNGTKLRIIGAANNVKEYYGCPKIKVTIDNSVEYYNGNMDLCFKTLLYEKSNLIQGEHIVTIEASEAGAVWFDAIDIDAGGELLDANPVKVSDITLDKTDITMNINTTENLNASVLPEDAANKDITWTSSDSNVCTVDENGKVTAVSYGSVVVTATANDGSGKSASCSVKVIDDRHGVLTVNMTNGKQYTYDMTLDKINAFTTWYDNRSEGNGKSYYVIQRKPSSGAYKTQTDYLSFNSISDFSVDTY